MGTERHSCMDVNECLENPCSQRCENTYGSFTCSCFPNFMLHHNKRTCKAMGPYRFLLYSTYSQVRKMSSYPNTKEIFWNTPLNKEINGMAVDVPRNRVYVSSLEVSEIYQIDLQTRTQKTFKADHGQRMAVDWGSGNIYIADNSGILGGRVRVCNFESKHCVTIIQLKKFVYIDHLEIDAREKLLFYSQEAIEHKGPSARSLISVRLDGTRKKFVNRMLPYPIFTLDVNKQMIFFGNAVEGKLLQMNYEGHQERTIASGLTDFMSAGFKALSVFQGYVMMAVNNRPFYVSCATFKRENNCYTTQLDVANIGHFLIVQDTMQPKVEDVCKDHRCSRICIPTNRGAKCLCNGAVQVGPGEECAEGEDDGGLVDIEEGGGGAANDETSSLTGTDLEPNIAGRVVLSILFILCGVAGVTFYLYRKRYLMSTFTIT